MANNVKKPGVQFFGKVDHNRAGKISSEYPAWYLTEQLADLKEKIAKDERALEAGKYPADRVGEVTEALNIKKRRYAEIKKSKPRPGPRQKDDLGEVYKELGDKIGSSMYTYSQMHMATVDAHSEARKNKIPFMVISSKAKEMAINCNIKMDDEFQKGKLSRHQAIRVWKIIGKLLDEPTNAEVLRKDMVTATQDTSIAAAAM